MRALALILLAGPALAQTPPIKPGLWEMKQLHLEVDGKPMPTMDQMAPQMAQQMAQMPPEMRKQMEAQMKAQGLALGGGGAIRTCISAAMLKQNQWGQAQQGQQDCKMDVLERSGSSWRWKVQCRAGQGEGSTVFSGDAGYTSDMHWRGTAKGQPQSMKTKVQARWLGADCGGMKPLATP